MDICPRGFEPHSWYSIIFYTSKFLDVSNEKLERSIYRPIVTQIVHISKNIITTNIVINRFLSLMRKYFVDEFKKVAKEEACL
jgi:hypothetical protein